MPSSSTGSSNPGNEECPYLSGFVWRQEYLTHVTYPHLVAVTVTNFFAFLPTFLLNSLVIVAVATRHRPRSKSNVLVAWLAGTDLLNGQVNQDIAIAIQLTPIFSDGPFCGLEKASSIALSGSFFLSPDNFVLISIDRCISIKHSLRYMTGIVTNQRIKAGLGLAWAVGLLVIIHELTLAVVDRGTDLYFLYMKVIYFTLSIPTLVANIVIGYTYCYIFSESRRQKKPLQSEQLLEEEAKKLKKESKAANNLILILGTLAITYIPSVVLMSVKGYSEDIFELHIVGVIWDCVVTFRLLGFLTV